MASRLTRNELHELELELAYIRAGAEVERHRYRVTGSLAALRRARLLENTADMVIGVLDGERAAALMLPPGSAS